MDNKHALNLLAESRQIFFRGIEAATVQENPEQKKFKEDHESDLIRKERATLVEEWKDSQDFIEKMKKGLGRKEGTAMYAAEVGHALFLEGKNKEALTMLNQAIKIDPKYELSYVIRSNVLRFLGSNTEARVDANFLIERNKEVQPNSPTDTSETVQKQNHYVTGLYERARTYRAEGKFKEALADLEAGHKILPTFIVVLRELYDLYRNSPDKSVRNPEKAEEVKQKIADFEKREQEQKKQEENNQSSLDNDAFIAATLPETAWRKSVA